MRFWFTTHWPPREDEPPGLQQGVWVPDGKFEVVRALAPGDLVWIYESKRGPTVKREGGSRRARSRPGRMGVVALVEAIEPVMELPSSSTEEYVGRKGVWWRYHAATMPVNTAGFIPMAQATVLLGHSPDWNFRGYGAGV